MTLKPLTARYFPRLLDATSGGSGLCWRARCRLWPDQCLRHWAARSARQVTPALTSYYRGEDQGLNYILLRGEYIEERTIFAWDNLLLNHNPTYYLCIVHTRMSNILLELTYICRVY